MIGIIRVLKALLTSASKPSPSQPARSARPSLESLEQREVPAVISAVIKTSSYGQKYLDIVGDNTASRVTLTQEYINTNQWSDILVIKDDANGFRKTVNIKQEKLSWVAFTGGSLRDSVRSSMPHLGLVADGKGGDDFLYGGRGHDILRGGDGNDWIEAGGGNNKIYGGAGNDQLFAGGLYTYIEGGDGRDVFYRASSTSAQYRTGNLNTPLRNLLGTFRE